MVKIYFNDGTRRKVSVRMFIYWLEKRKLDIDESNIYLTMFISQNMYIYRREIAGF